MSRILLIDTCTERGLVALAEAGELVWCEYLPFGLHSSAALMPTLERGLADQAWTVGCLDAIAVTVGPGSYTGIRIGATVAQSMSFAKHLPLVGICSLRGYVPIEDGPFAAVIDAKLGGAYVLCGERCAGKITRASAPKLISLNLLREHVGTRRLFCPRVKRLQERLLEIEPDWHPEWNELSPCAEALLAQASAELQAGNFTQNGRVELMYLRKTQAEIEREDAQL